MQPQATLCIPKVALHSPHSILHTSRFTLHFISSHLIKAHLISSQMSSKFFSIPFISSEQCSSFKCLHTEALTHSTLLHTANFYTQKFLLSEFLHVDTLTPQRNFQTHNFLHTSFYTQQTFINSTLLHTETFTQRCFYAQKLLRAMAPEITAPKPDLVAEAKRRPKLRKICWQISHSSKIYDAQLQNTSVYNAHSRSSEEPLCSYIAICGAKWQTQCMSTHMWQQNVATFVQPLHCDLPPQSPKTARKRTTARCKTPVGTNPRQNERPSPVAQTRYPLSPA